MTPSLKAIIEGFGDYLRHDGLDVEHQANEIKKALAKAEREGDPDIALSFTNEVLKAHGVEAIHRGDDYDRYYGDVVALYVNMGDAYAATLVYDVKQHRFLITDYAQWIQDEEQAGRLVPNEKDFNW